MGTGKSAVGRRLARRLGRRFVDTDAWIARRAGRPIPEIFQLRGESAFRELETRAARTYSTPSRCVLSTGGGMLGRDENVASLRRGGVLVCLEASPEIILERTAPWEGRPMLKTAGNPREAVESLLAERAERYALADWRVDTTHLSLDQVTEAICERLPSLFQAAAIRSGSQPVY
jgi:shikimate kinase